MAPINSIAKNPEEFLNTPIKTKENRTIYVRDVAQVIDGADQTVGYALINGKRSVYLPIVKKADASTLEAVQNLKASIPLLKNQLPEDVDVRYEFDQSTYIERALSTLIHEGILGAVFTGLVILLFLGDTRGAIIVVFTIPIAILTAGEGKLFLVIATVISSGVRPFDCIAVGLMLTTMVRAFPPKGAGEVIPGISVNIGRIRVVAKV